MTSGLDGFDQKLERVFGTLDGRSETTFISDSGVGQTVLLLDDTLQGVVDLGTHLHGLSEAGSSGGQDHEFLESETVTGVGTTVDNVERRGGEDVGSLDTGEFGQVLVERDTLWIGETSIASISIRWIDLVTTNLLSGTSFRDSHGDTEDGVGTELALVRGTVQLDQQVINLLLLSDVQTRADQFLGDDVVDVGNGLGNTLSDVGRLVIISQLNGLVDTGGSTRGDLRSESTLFGVDVDLDGGVTSRVEDLANEGS